MNFYKKICKNSNKPKSKFVTDMIYGISKSKNILLSSISEHLNEKTKKLNTIDRLSSNLSKDLSNSIDANYSSLVFDSLGNNPVFLVDDSDIIKPLGEKFENLGFSLEMAQVRIKHMRKVIVLLKLLGLLRI